MSRPRGSNADEWHLFLSKHLDNRATHPSGLTYVSVQIAEAIDAANASHDSLLAAAKEMMSAIAARDIGSFVWGSKRAEMLRAAIDAAEELKL